MTINYMVPLILGLGAQELVLIAILALLFFGGKRIPELMNGIGKGVKSFKDGMNGIETDIKKDKTEQPTEKKDDSEAK